MRIVNYSCKKFYYLAQVGCFVTRWGHEITQDLLPSRDTHRSGSSSGNIFILHFLNNFEATEFVVGQA